MSFVNTQYLPHMLAAILVLWALLAYLNVKYFRWIKNYWFFDRSWMSRFSSVLYALGLMLIIVSLLDLRGPEEKIRSNIPDQRTIIIIDSSTSMLSEDVRPSRFIKALQLARHFVKNAAGHQISVVLFSDIQKRLVPFTDDLDLLDSRLTALEKTNSVGGGSNISQAIGEAVQYFENEDSDKGSAGNILVFTDAEESEGGMDVDLGSNINLAVVGIGTAKGGNIPLRWDDGSFRGYKTYKGEAVITKLDEATIRNFGKRVKNYKYWIVNSYSLPSEEILTFFRNAFSKSTGKGDVRIRPVYSYYILIPAIIIYCLSVFIGRFRSFRITLSLLLLCFTSNPRVQAQENEPPKMSPGLVKELDRMKAGKTNRDEILKIAEKLLRENRNDQASELYKEYTKGSDEEAVRFNQITALLKNGKLSEALPAAQTLLRDSKDENLKDKLRSNLLLAVNQEEKKDQKQKNKDQKEDDKKSEDNKDGKQDKGKDGKNPEDNKDQKGKDGQKKDDDKNQDGKSGQNQKPQDKKDGEDKDKKDKEQEKDPKDIKAPPRESRPQSVEEKEKMIEQKRKMVKTPAMVKQIMSNDRELQKRMMDTSTKERAEQSKRDW